MDQAIEPIRAAGVILRAPDGSILMLKRVDDGSWTFPGGCIDELAAVTAAIRRTIEDDRFPHAPRLDPLKAALPSSLPQAPPPAKDKRARR